MRCEQYKTVCTRICHNNIAVCGFFIDFHCVIRRLANTIQPYAYIYCLKLPSAHSDNKENDEINDQNRQKSENRNARKHSKMFFFSTFHSFYIARRCQIATKQRKNHTATIFLLAVVVVDRLIPCFSFCFTCSLIFSYSFLFSVSLVAVITD